MRWPHHSLFILSMHLQGIQLSTWDPCSTFNPWSFRKSPQKPQRRRHKSIIWYHELWFFILIFVLDFGFLVVHHLHIVLLFSNFRFQLVCCLEILIVASCSIVLEQSLCNPCAILCRNPYRIVLLFYFWFTWVLFAILIGSFCVSWVILISESNYVLSKSCFS